ncbi:hypothetical protein ACF07T_14965 [Streptomyces sp. NPDC015184]|uniref:hypothetical protein n=1 Tax=Streptomyces sp. NPDC015184 TaxID=3364946 RepID=UPI003702C003
MADRATSEKTTEDGDELWEYFRGWAPSQTNVTPVGRALGKADADAVRYDATATVDAAVAAADAAQKVLVNVEAGPDEGLGHEEANRLIGQLRSDTEAVREATAAADVERRGTALDGRRDRGEGQDAPGRAVDPRRPPGLPGETCELRDGS